MLISIHLWKNHLAHHALTMFSLGAPSALVEQMYNLNRGYQRTEPAPDISTVESLSDATGFRNALGNEGNYGAFLHKFESEIMELGVEAILHKYLFAPDEEAATDLFSRLFMGKFGFFRFIRLRAVTGFLIRKRRLLASHYSFRVRYRVSAAVGCCRGACSGRRSS